jgi:ABC-type multidrug transport system fused ATPase/permease subunit
LAAAFFAGASAFLAGAAAVLAEAFLAGAAAAVLAAAFLAGAAAFLAGAFTAAFSACLAAAFSARALANFVSTMPASVVEGENFTSLRAAILILSPVLGLRPTRAARWPILKLPKPEMATGLPFFSSVHRASITVSSMRAAAAFESSCFSASRAARSLRFMRFKRVEKP